LFLKRPISDWTDAIAGKPPPTVRGRSASAWVGGTRHQDALIFLPLKSPLILPASRFSRSVLVPAC
ncbi:hypothetical protein, partial [Pseudomonas viridiflava]|uniref:hypothetical protein n=1 Tax=Pseudomonas viridiflava TaxID=33069 RepID=UPI00197E2F25